VCQSRSAVLSRAPFRWRRASWRWSAPRRGSLWPFGGVASAARGRCVAPCRATGGFASSEADETLLRRLTVCVLYAGLLGICGRRCVYPGASPLNVATDLLCALDVVFLRPLAHAGSSALRVDTSRLPSASPRLGLLRGLRSPAPLRRSVQSLCRLTQVCV
jgi:hypothetical protein